MMLEKNPTTRKILRRLLELEDKAKGKPFPSMRRVPQVSIYACGPATLEMLFSYVGLRVSQTRLIRSIRAQNKIKTWGIDVNDMAKTSKFAAKGKYIFWRKAKATINDLDLVVNKYHFPVGVEWQGVFYENEDEDSGHYGVVTSVNKNDGYLRIADPYFNGYFDFKETDRKFSIKEFFKKWWDVNEVAVSGTTKRRKIKDIRIMFIITPKGETWPKKLGMTKLYS